ncbi:hypothetical protein [Dyadobacter sp. 676]|uniref:DUF885 domain-containing protein n=1 Tax=Dyadobacter sp. 676 TaxID=3088362 RepID=A0AAU8FK16_9BACT
MDFGVILVKSIFNILNPMTHMYVTRLRWVVFLLSWLTTFGAVAQSSKSQFNLYEQTSEVAGLVIRYAQDIRAVKYFYGPMPVQGRSAQGGGQVLNSPEQRKRLREVDHGYLNQLAKVDFNAMSIYGKVDYLLLKRNIDDHLLTLDQEEKEYAQIEKYIPFATGIYELEKARRRGATVDGQAVAGKLNDLQKEVSKAEESFRKLESIDMPLSRMGVEALNGLEARLKSTFEFYNGYDPMFTWWVPKPYKTLDSTLNAFAKLVRSKGKLNTTQKEDASGIKGVPIGRDELIRQLRAEMISYTPEELIDLANREFAWCDRELLKASRGNGFWQ